MNITNFTTWFIGQFVSMGQTLIGYLNNIKIYNTVSLLDFIITIVIIGAFIGIILTIPQNAMANADRQNIKRRIKENDKRKREKKK